MQHFLPNRTNSSAASSRPKPAPTQQPALPTPATPEPRPHKDRQDRGHSCLVRCYPFPKRQGPRPKIALDPAPQNSWLIRRINLAWVSRPPGPESRYRQTTQQAVSNVPLVTSLSAGCRGKCVIDSPRAHSSARASNRCDSGQNKTHTFSYRVRERCARATRPSVFGPKRSRVCISTTCYGIHDPSNGPIMCDGCLSTSQSVS